MPDDAIARLTRLSQQRYLQSRDRRLRGVGVVRPQERDAARGTYRATTETGGTINAHLLSNVSDNQGRSLQWDGQAMQGQRINPFQGLIVLRTGKHRFEVKILYAQNSGSSSVFSGYLNKHYVLVTLSLSGAKDEPKKIVSHQDLGVAQSSWSRVSSGGSRTIVSSQEMFFLCPDYDEVAKWVCTTSHFLPENTQEGDLSGDITVSVGSEAMALSSYSAGPDQPTVYPDSVFTYLAGQGRYPLIVSPDFAEMASNILYTGYGFAPAPGVFWPGSVALPNGKVQFNAQFYFFANFSYASVAFYPYAAYGGIERTHTSYEANRSLFKNEVSFVTAPEGIQAVYSTGKRVLIDTGNVQPILNGISPGLWYPADAMFVGPKGVLPKGEDSPTGARLATPYVAEEILRLGLGSFY